MITFMANKRVIFGGIGIVLGILHVIHLFSK